MPRWMWGVTRLYRTRNACMTESMRKINSNTRENRSMEFERIRRRNKSRKWVKPRSRKTGEGVMFSAGDWERYEEELGVN